jgi:hypothetical protein
LFCGDEFLSQMTWTVWSMHDGFVAIRSDVSWLYDDCVVRKNGAWSIRGVSNLANDDLCAGDVKKSDPAMCIGGQSESVCLSHRENGDDGSEASGRGWSGHQQDRDVSA